MTDPIYNIEKMEEFVETRAEEHGLHSALSALEYAKKAHAGQTRRNVDIPYFFHPLSLACHALSLGIKDDDIIAVCLLHDVVEDCGVKAEELPFNGRIRELVRLLTRTDAPGPCPGKEEMINAYYEAIGKDSDAAFVKCLDRCHNLSSMCDGMTRNKMVKYLKETDEYYPVLLSIIQRTPRYSNAGNILSYHITSLVSAYKYFLFTND